MDNVSNDLNKQFPMTNELVLDQMDNYHIYCSDDSIVDATMYDVNWNKMSSCWKVMELYELLMYCV